MQQASIQSLVGVMVTLQMATGSRQRHHHGDIFVSGNDFRASLYGSIRGRYRFSGLDITFRVADFLPKYRSVTNRSISFNYPSSYLIQSRYEI
ncbi:hypothetical protein O9992_23585 [Vibrio lentus]|nr:hypothetical protein [Vibrio lentus]